MAVYKKKPKKTKKRFDKISLDSGVYVPEGMTRAYSDGSTVVMVYDNSPTSHGNAIKVMVRNRAETPIKNHWSELQAIKNDIFGRDATAVEYYPAESELVNVKNIYWLWLYPKGILPIPIL
jgi:hypothetical protein